MAIKSVTAANLAEHVADKRSSGANISTHEQVAAMALEANKVTEKPAEGEKTPVVGTTTETVSTAPEPQGTPGPKPKKEDNAFSERIKELTEQKRELEEFSEGEYTARLQAQRRIQELEGQIAALQPKPPEKAEDTDPAPDPTKYTDQKKYLDDRDAWNRRQAIREFRKEQETEDQKKETQRLIAEANSRREASLAAARKEHSDFDEVIKRAAREVELKAIPAPPPHVEAVLVDSDYSAHILYHFATHPDEAKRIFALRPAKAALELGRLETQFAKGEVKADPKAETKSAPQGAPQTSRAPPPMPSLNGGVGDVPHDFTTPQPFQEYKRKRIDEIRRKRGH